MRSSAHLFEPLSAVAVNCILAADQAAGFGPGGTMPNRNRFYVFLTLRGDDVEVRTVAVKSAKRWETPVVKEVVRACVGESLFYVRDLAYGCMQGYFVDWSREGVGPEQSWGYRGSWQPEAWALRCNWKIHAPVINPEILQSTSRFRWSAWQPGNGHILDYLKLYTQHPGIEFLSKQGLGQYCTKVALLRKLKADPAFRRYFSRNLPEIKERESSVPEILKAYHNGMTLEEAGEHIQARREFQYCKLPREVDACKALAYVQSKKLRRDDYTDYLKNCQTAGLNLADTKVAFPRQFEPRRRELQDRADIIHAAQNAAKNKDLNCKLQNIASKWSWLEQKHRNYQVHIPRTALDFTAEGRALANCLGESYAAKVARGDVLVVFVRQARQPGDAFVAAEYDLKRNRISQCYAAKNSRPADSVSRFVNRLFKDATKSTKKIQETS
jgi:hypothetical protein